MRRVLRVLGMALCAALLHAGEVRDFKMPGGGVLSAELVNLAGGKVYLRAAGGVQTAEFEKLSPEDALYATEWALARAQKKGGVFKTRLAPLRGESAQKKVDDKGTFFLYTYWDEGYKIYLQSLLPVRLDGLKVAYQLFYFKEDPYAERKGGGELCALSGALRLDALQGGETAVLETQKAPLRARKITGYRGDAAFFNRDDGRRKSEDRLEGLWLKIYWRGKEIGEWASSGKLARGREFPQDTAFDAPP